MWKDATCTEAAKYYYSCKRCEALSEDKTFENGKALGHDYKIVINEPTCTEAGSSASTCSSVSCQAAMS